MSERTAVLSSRFAGIFAIAFGLLTIISGGRALFGGEAAQAAVGAAVPFVLWFNFAAGFVYEAAGIGILLRRSWGFLLSVAIAISTLVVFAAFGLHVMQGGAYEPRTVVAMTFRFMAWVLMTILARWTSQAPARRI